MRKTILILTIAVLALTGCTKLTLPDTEKGTYDPAKGALVTISSIGINVDAALEGMSAARATTQMLPVGSTFRLYAFRKGETDFGKILATRKYSIQGTPGSPSLQHGEEPLYLPLGAVDIYIVGPTEAQVDLGDPNYPVRGVEVAKATGVYPHIGVDLVSSYTTVTIGTDLNNLSLSPLQHKMSLVEVQAIKPDEATYIDFALQWVSIDDQVETGSFVFNSNGGEIIPTNEGKTELFLHKVEEMEAGRQYRVSSYFIPRNDTYMRIALAFECTRPDGSDIVKRLNSGAKNYALPAGKRTLFTAKPLLSEFLSFRQQLLPWDVEDKGEELVPTFGGYVFSYSGEDAPIERDGKRYWRDRSGNGMDAELVGDIRYDAQEKYYYQGDEQATILIPQIAYRQNFMLEVACRSKCETQNGLLLQFSSDEAEKALQLHLPYSNGYVYFDLGDATDRRTLSSVYLPDQRMFENFATYSFIKTTAGARGTATTTTICRNGTQLAQKAFYELASYSFTTNKVFTPSSGKDKKIYAMRMIDNQTTAANFLKLHQNNFRVDASRYLQMNIPEDLAARDYVSQGMVLNLRGDKMTTATKAFPGIVNGVEATAAYPYWPDQSVAKNDMVRVSGSISQSAYGYRFSNALCKLYKPLSVQQEMTIEVVALADNKTTSTGSSLFNLASKPTGLDDARECHVQYFTEGSKFTVNAPYPRNRNSIEHTGEFPSPVPPLASLQATPNQLTITRQTNGTLAAYINNLPVGEAEATEELLPMTHCYIGNNGISSGTLTTPQQPFSGIIYAIRVYNRILTQQEREYNYEIDKVKYGIRK